MLVPHRLVVSCLVALAAAGLACQTRPSQTRETMTVTAPPPAPRRPVTDVYHGVTMTDDYRWLENWNDPVVRTWTDAQNQYARHLLDAIPNRTAMAGRLAELVVAQAPRWFALEWRKGTLFALKSQPPKQQPFLITLAPTADPASERVIVDPNQIDPRGSTAIDFYAPSPDGALVAVSLSQGGNEVGSVHVYDVTTGKEHGDVIPHVKGGTAGGSLAWVADGFGFFYTRYRREGERPASAAPVVFAR